jgi:hypothetical protein
MEFINKIFSMRMAQQSKIPEKPLGLPEILTD